jgi:hypothetical protein
MIPANDWLVRSKKSSQRRHVKKLESCSNAIDLHSMIVESHFNDFDSFSNSGN